MSALFSEKLANEYPHFSDLPPSVKGKLQGLCTLNIDKIKWTTTKTFNLVKLKIQWWGEQQGNIFDKIQILSLSKRFNNTVEQVQNNPLISVCYRVNTNYVLFRSYLKNCDPLHIEIFSSKTSDYIGHANIVLLDNFYEKTTKKDCVSSSFSSDILSTRNFKLGEITITLDISMNANEAQNKMRQSVKPFSKKVDKQFPVFETKTQKHSISNKENIKVIGQKKALSFRKHKLPKSRALSSQNKGSNKNPVESTNKVKNDVYTTCNDSLIEKTNVNTRKLSLADYLFGKIMSKNEEDKIMSEILQMSPSHSVIEEMNKVEHLNLTPILQKNENSINELYTIEITLFSLELNEVGLLQLKDYCQKLRNSKFIIKCAVTSKLFKGKELKFVSGVFDTFHIKKTIFNKHLLQNVQIYQKTATNVYLNFGFCVKSIEEDANTPHLIGLTRINVADVISTKSKYRKCAVIDEHNLVKGSIMVKLEIQAGSSLKVDNITDFNQCLDKIIANTSRNSETPQHPHSSNFFDQQPKNFTSHPNNSNDVCKRRYENKIMQTDSSDLNIKLSNEENSYLNEYRDTEVIDTKIKEKSKISKVFQGLLFIEEMRNMRDQGRFSEYFITYEGFWNECQESSELSINHIFNYLKIFPVICDDDFLKSVQNNHLELKLWEKINGFAEKLVGSTKVPLHQFYIAFKDTEMIEHLSRNKLPIISTDSWSNFISPLSSELYCRGKILLAIGSENQIDYLKLSRNLHESNLSNAIVNTNIDPDAKIKNNIKAFIESLPQKLHDPIEINTQSKRPPTSSSLSSTKSSEKLQLRKTSDLLDTLQKALAEPPTNCSVDTYSIPHNPISSEVFLDQTQFINDCIKMQVNIDQAVNLPKVFLKKSRNTRKNNGTTLQPLEYEPHSYATFEAFTDHLDEKSLLPNTIKSHEGIVYCTNVVKSCNPEWNESFEVLIKFDVLKNPQKNFVVKIWRKHSYNLTKIDASPFEDSVIGFSVIDLSPLLTGLPILSGYYNIVDFSGRCNGQLKISLKPLDDISRFRHPESPLVPLMCPLNIDINSLESSSNDATSSLLSHTLKRKFTELDEITQRLKARLFDVMEDKNFDPDEEFEKDLNTSVEDDENEKNNKEDFSWLKKNNDIEKTELNNVIETQDQTSSKNSVLTRRDTGTGCSSSDEAMQQSSFTIDDLLKKYDLDTLMNPNIFKNLLDPSLANSDSTPTLIPKKIDDDNEKANESDVTTVSSISNDQIQTIQKALQRTSIDDQKSSRKDPDGRNNTFE